MFPRAARYAPARMTNPAVTMELVRQAQAGDRESLERVLERYYDRVRRAVSIRMGPRVRSWTDSVDIMTRTFMKALEKFDAFEMRNESSLLQWLVKIAEGMIHDAADERNAACRNPDREKSMDAGSSGGAEKTAVHSPLPDPATTIMSDLGKREDRGLVDRAIAAMDEADRDILVQYYYLDMTWEEIAEKQGALAAGADATRRTQAADTMRKRAAAARARLAIQLQRMRRSEGDRGAAAPGST